MSWLGSQEGSCSCRRHVHVGSKQFEAELQAEGLPIESLPLEAAMALAAREEARPLHKLSLVRILAILLKF